MTHVCYFTDAEFFGGAERYIATVARSLDPSRFKASVLMREGADARLDDWARQLEAGGITVVRVSMRAPFRPGDGAGIVRAISRLSPDIVHVNMPGPYSGQMGLAPFFARLAGVRAVVSTEHLPGVERLWKRALVRRIGYRVDRVVTVCEANVSHLTGTHGVDAAKVVVIPNALGADFGRSAAAPTGTRARLGIAPQVVTVMFLGNLLEHKGPHRVAEALVGLPGLPWHFLAVGTGPMQLRCQEIFSAAGMTDRVTFTGAVAEDDVPDLVAASEVLSLPSTIEGMPYVILEAMACALPVVASDVYGIPEMIVQGETGYLVEPLDVAALRGCLETRITEPGLREKMGSAARSRFETHFTLDRQHEAIERVYDEVTGGEAR